MNIVLLFELGYSNLFFFVYLLKDIMDELMNIINNFSFRNIKRHNKQENIKYFYNIKK